MAVIFRGLVLLFLLAAPLVQGADVALVMSVQGKVERLVAPGTVPVEPFIKLKEGDKLVLDRHARLQLVYFESARQETWSESGKLEVGRSESKAADARMPEIKQLPAVLVKQLAHTPSVDSQGRAGVLRLRSIPTPGGIARIEDNYRQLRATADIQDLSPEMYRLSGYFDMRELDKVEEAMGDLLKSYPGNPEAKLLVALYTRAVADARRSPPQ